MKGLHMWGMLTSWHVDTAWSFVLRLPDRSMCFVNNLQAPSSCASRIWFILCSCWRTSWSWVYLFCFELGCFELELVLAFCIMQCMNAFTISGQPPAASCLHLQLSWMGSYGHRSPKASIAISTAQWPQLTHAWSAWLKISPNAKHTLTRRDVISCMQLTNRLHFLPACLVLNLLLLSPSITNNHVALRTIWASRRQLSS